MEKGKKRDKEIRAKETKKEKKERKKRKKKKRKKKKNGKSTPVLEPEHPPPFPTQELPLPMCKKR